MRNLAILGSTGSIGRSALAVVDEHPARLRVVSLAAGENADLLAEQAARYRPQLLAMATAGAAARLRDHIGTAVPVAEGAEGLVAAATHPDVDLVLCASAGTAGLEAALAAIEAGKAIALANKEILVMAGEVVTAAAARCGVPILPVDSEHNAIHQCLHGRPRGEIRRLVLTASGGPFRTHSREAMRAVTPAQALDHPTWRMGRKITIDSATLMNKGLEVIEARWLFDVAADRIDVVVHPQSVVHSMVELTDGSVMAQLGVTDMRLPIQYACSYPDRWETSIPSLDLTRLGQLAFEAPDHERFPCLALAYRVLREGGTAPVVLNAANEVAVAAFLAGDLPFMGIPEVIAHTLDAHETGPAASLQEVRAADAWAREWAAAFARGVELRG
ncbi:MAG: 1-deoxy-D-xylulose-5-phosphate reductoisomerase [Acidobacteria bacterium]|nr:1-deoxy-D-xylulose-5-phosphate reductoisomerase [Acidobacteriota bacterium]